MTQPPSAASVRNLAGGDAAIVVDGSSFDFGGQVRLGLSGFNGALTLQNGSTGVIGGSTELGRSSASNSSGSISVLSGSTLTTGQLLIGDVLSATSTGHVATVTVDGLNSAVMMAGASPLIVGDSANANSAAALRVRNNGAFTTGTGQTTIQSGGSLEVESGGTFDAHGSVVVRFGATLRLEGGAVNANAGLDFSDGTLDIEDGVLSVSGGALVPNLIPGFGTIVVLDGPTANELPHLVMGTGANLEVSTSCVVGSQHRGELTITDGGTVTSLAGTIGSNADSIGVTTIDGVGSTWTASLNLTVGRDGQGTLDIQNGGGVSSGPGQIAAGAGSTGFATVDGVGRHLHRSYGPVADGGV